LALVQLPELGELLGLWTDEAQEANEEGESAADPELH
jgi:hypothetical protein